MARPGGGGSMGSRGGRTWSAPAPTRTAPSGAMPMDRTIAPPASPGSAIPGYGAPYRSGASSMMGMRHPFLRAFAGGMLGAGLFGLITGHGFFGGIHGLFSFIWFLLQIAVIALIVRWLFRKFVSRRASAPSPFGASPFSATRNGGSAPLQISSEDYQAFQRLLLNIQSAWSQQNIRALQGMATPEMVGYFNEQLSGLTSRGERNIVSDVQFIQGDLAEAWSENGYDYATVAMRYSLIDLTTDMTGRVVEGSSTEPVTLTELWTFIRPSRGGAWLLSAIQQTR
ncbi:Tim44 domain-containing protein [Acetobacter nitrogenifigens]|nr:TIM44-like domain-containing protein [Acetobacter nitrogenifigens]